MTVFGARLLSSAISNVPQLVLTTAVSASPFLTVCLGALKLTFFGAGAATFLQPAVLASELESLPPPLREIRIAATTPAAIRANTPSAIHLLRSDVPSTAAES